MVDSVSNEKTGGEVKITSKSQMRAINKANNPFQKNFSRKKEDFLCEKCGTSVKGTGYTNHCPVCLYSKHVDIKPGDRLAACMGLMKPIRVEGTEKEYRVIHKCTVCKYEKINKVVPSDSIEALVAIIKESSSNYSKVR